MEAGGESGFSLQIYSTDKSATIIDDSVFDV
jgi:hypothetical protein